MAEGGGGFTEVPAEVVRALTQDDIQCPAGNLAGHTACRCAIEGTVIEGRSNPNSIEAFCLGDFTACPTWRKEKERVWAGDPTPLVDRDADLRAGMQQRKAAIVARRERAQELLHSDTEEGRKFRGKLRRLVDPDKNPALRRRPPRPEPLQRPNGAIDVNRALAGAIERGEVAAGG